MKRTHRNSHLRIYTPACPNGADQQYFAGKALDLLTGLASVVGFITAVAFLFIFA
ncbi:MAG: hypothetical protein Q4F17_05170 [Eubacteriales bacterium]|nr:hypothetical protein [Eubacteriales bacterium]